MGGAPRPAPCSESVTANVTTTAGLVFWFPPSQKRRERTLCGPPTRPHGSLGVFPRAGAGRAEVLVDVGGGQADADGGGRWGPPPTRDGTKCAEWGVPGGAGCDRPERLVVDGLVGIRAGGIGLCPLMKVRCVPRPRAGDCVCQQGLQQRVDIGGKRSARPPQAHSGPRLLASGGCEMGTGPLSATAATLPLSLMSPGLAQGGLRTCTPPLVAPWPPGPSESATVPKTDP